MSGFRLKIKGMIFFPLFLFLFLWSCQSENARQKSQASEVEILKEQNSVILKVKDSSYYNSDFESYVHGMTENQLHALSPASLSRLMDNFIEERIFLQAAKDQNLSLTWEEKKGYLAKLRRESWSGVQKGPIDEAEYKNLFDRLLIEKYTFELVKDLDVEDGEIKEYYELHKEEFLKPERVEASQVLLKTEEKAIELLEKLKGASDEEFREIAEKESVGIEADKGGMMGIFEMGELPYEMEKVIFSLKEGELSQVVESAYGYHIFRLDKRYQPELISLEEASHSIKVKILDQKIKAFISQHAEDLKNSVVWSFYPQNLAFPYQRNSP